jgi:hypothetical protein
MTSFVAQGSEFEKTVKNILRGLGVELRQPR